MLKSTKTWSNSGAVRFGYGLILLLTTIFIIKIIFGKPTFADWYLTLLRPALLVFYLLLLPSFYFAITGKAKAASLKVAVNVVSLVILLVVGWLLVGALMTGFGITCTGLFGVRDASSCVQNQMLWVSMLMFPQIFLPALAVGAALFIKGLIDQYDATR